MVNKKEETVVSEQEQVTKEILSANEMKMLRKSVTMPSGAALVTPPSHTGESLSKVRKDIKNLFALFLTNQYVARAINVRADTLISRGYDIVGDDKEGVKRCKELIAKSGGINLFKQLSVSTDIAGNGFLEKIYNKRGTAILRLKHVHPLTIDFKKDVSSNRVLVKNGKPVGYVQKSIDEHGVEIEKPVNYDFLEHLKYNTLGDEFSGMSSIQPGYDTILRLMNMEYAAATASIKTANPLMVLTCHSKSPHQVAQWSNILGNISDSGQIFIPEGMKVDMLKPGTQNFSDYSEYFLNAIVALFGVPKSVLLGESGSSNRSEGVVLTRHFYSSIHSLQSYQEDFFNKIFEEYGMIAGFKAPKLVFNDIAEDAEALSASAIELFTAGIITKEEAREMIGLERTTKGTFANKVLSDKSVKKEIQFPSQPGSPKSGSQKNIKKQQKKDPNSNVSPFTK